MILAANPPMLTGPDRTSSPSEILVAWRAAERRYAQATPGTEDAAAQHAEMRRLMDEYEWRVRGGVPTPDERRGRR